MYFTIKTIQLYERKAYHLYNLLQLNFPRQQILTICYIFFHFFFYFSQFFTLNNIQTKYLSFILSGVSDSKRVVCNVGDLAFHPWVRKSLEERFQHKRIPWTKKSLAGYILWRHKESDKTEQLTLLLLWFSLKLAFIFHSLNHLNISLDEYIYVTNS